MTNVQEAPKSRANGQMKNKKSHYDSNQEESRDVRYRRASHAAHHESVGVSPILMISAASVIFAGFVLLGLQQTQGKVDTLANELAEFKPSGSNDLFQSLPGTDRYGGGRLAPNAFGMQDFQKYFRVEPLYENELDPKIADKILAHDIAQDRLYKDMERSLDRVMLKYEPFLVNKQANINDDRFYVRYADEIRGYGLFAKVDINKGDVLGIYTGVVTATHFSTDYMWIYPSEIFTDAGKKLHLGVDSFNRGNYLRFVNHDVDPNCQVVMIPYNNQWHVFYVATRKIARDDEFLVSYGSAYWKDRTQVDKFGNLVGPIKSTKATRTKSQNSSKVKSRKSNESEVTQDEIEAQL